jgi:hypothetical protein
VRSGASSSTLFGCCRSSDSKYWVVDMATAMLVTVPTTTHRLRIYSIVVSVTGVCLAFLRKRPAHANGNSERAAARGHAAGGAVHLGGAVTHNTNKGIA